MKAIQNIINNFDPEYDVTEYLNAPDQAGSHSIFHTVWPGHVAALELLLKARADPNIQNQRENTALHLACERMHTQVIYLLIRYGADTSLMNAKKLLCWQTPGEEADQQKMKQFVERCVLARRNGFAHNDTVLQPVDPNAITPAKREFYVRQALHAHKLAQQAYTELAAPAATPLLASALKASPNPNLSLGLRPDQVLHRPSSAETKPGDAKARKKKKAAETDPSPKTSDLAQAASQAIAELAKRAPPDSTAAAILRAKDQEAQTALLRNSAQTPPIYRPSTQRVELGRRNVFLNSAGVSVTELMRAGARQAATVAQEYARGLGYAKRKSISTDDEVTNSTGLQMDSKQHATGDGNQSTEDYEGDERKAECDVTDPNKFLDLVHVLARQSDVRPATVDAPPTLPIQRQRREIGIRTALARLLSQQQLGSQSASSHQSGVSVDSDQSKQCLNALMLAYTKAKETPAKGAQPGVEDSLKLFQSMTIGKQLALVTEALESTQHASRGSPRPSEMSLSPIPRTKSARATDQVDAAIVDKVVTDLVSRPASREVLVSARRSKSKPRSKSRSPRKSMLKQPTSRDDTLAEAQRLLQHVNVAKAMKLAHASALAASPALRATLLRELIRLQTSPHPERDDEGQPQAQESSTAPKAGTRGVTAQSGSTSSSNQNTSNANNANNTGAERPFFPVLGASGVTSAFDREFRRAGANLVSTTDPDTLATLDAISASLAAPAIPLPKIAQASDKRKSIDSIEDDLETLSMTQQSTTNKSWEQRSSKTQLPLYHSLDTLMKVKIRDLQVGRREREQRMAVSGAKRATGLLSKSNDPDEDISQANQSESVQNEDGASSDRRRKFRFNYEKYVEAAAMGKRMFDVPVNPDSALSKARWLVQSKEAAKAAEEARNAQIETEERKRRLYAKRVISVRHNRTEQGVTDAASPSPTKPQSASTQNQSSPTMITGVRVPSAVARPQPIQRTQQPQHAASHIGQAPAATSTSTTRVGELPSLTNKVVSTTQHLPPPRKIASTMQRQHAERLASREAKRQEYLDMDSTPEDNLDTELKDLVGRFDAIMAQQQSRPPTAENGQSVEYIDERDLQIRPEVEDVLHLADQRTVSTSLPTYIDLQRNLDSAHMMLVATGLTRGEPTQKWWPKLKQSFMRDREQLKQLHAQLLEEQQQQLNATTQEGVAEEQPSAPPSQQSSIERHAWIREWRDQLAAHNITLPADIQNYFEVALAPVSDTPAVPEIQAPSSHSKSQTQQDPSHQQQPVDNQRDEQVLRQDQVVRDELAFADASQAPTTHSPTSSIHVKPTGPLPAELRELEKERAKWRAERAQAEKLQRATIRREAFLTIRGGTHLQTERADAAFLRRMTTMNR